MNPDLINIAIVVPVHNRKEKTLNFLHYLQSIDKKNMHVTTVVVDDGSTDGTSEAIEHEYPGVVVLHGSGNLWWTGATNIGVRWVLEHNIDYVLIINDDVQFKNNFLVDLVDTARNNLKAMTCGVILDIENPDRIISAGRYAKGFLGYNYSGYLSGADITMLPNNEYESDIESGYAILIPVELFRENGLFDSRRFPHHMGDMDFVLRAKKRGYKVIVNPHAMLFTQIGGNYFHNNILNRGLWVTIKNFIDIKSTVNIRTRWYFYLRHTPYCLGLVSFVFFIIRMVIAIIMKLALPQNMLRRIVEKRTVDPLSKT